MSSLRSTARAALAVAALAAAVPLAACKKDALPKGQVTPEVKALLAHLPADAVIASGVNLAAARESAIYKVLVERGLPAPPQELVAIKAACNLDPVAAANQVVVTTGDDLQDRKGIFLAIQGAFSKDAITDCMAKAGGSVTVAEEGELTVYQAEGQKLYTRWPAADTVIASLADDGSPEPMKKVASGGGAAGNQALMAYVSKVDTSSAFWLAGSFPSQMRSQLVGIPGAPDGFFFSANPAGDGAVLLLGLKLDSADVAEATASQLREQKGQLKSMMPDPKLAEILGRVEVLQSGADVAFKLQLSGADIEHLVSMASGLLGTGLGM